MILELTLNLITDKQLSLPQEKETLNTYNKLKNQWIHYAEFAGREALFKFTVNTAKFNKILNEVNILNENAPKKELNLEPDDSHDQKLLLRENQSVKIELLKRALSAHIFEQHLVKKNTINIDIQIKQKLKSFSKILEKIKEFLKKDLASVMESGRGVVGFGIKYKIHHGTLYFSGVVKDDFKDKTLVIQITTVSGRIIKEIYIEEGEASERNYIVSDEVL